MGRIRSFLRMMITTIICLAMSIIPEKKIIETVKEGQALTVGENKKETVWFGKKIKISELKYVPSYKGKKQIKRSMRRKYPGGPGDQRSCLKKQDLIIFI